MIRKFIVFCLLFAPFAIQGQPEMECKKLTKKYVGGTGNDCCISDAQEADKNLLNAQNNFQDSLTKLHAPFGLPRSKNENIVILYNYGYICGYDTVYNIPIWVQYKMLDQQSWIGNLPRTDCFRPDPRLPEHEQITYDEYTHSGFDRGHLKPANDAKSNLNEHLNSFVMTNMAPQHPKMNRSEWMMIEAYINAISRKDTIYRSYMITGSIIDENPDWVNADGKTKRIAIPSWFYKIFFFRGKAGDWQYWVYYVKNDNEKVDIRAFEEELRSNIKSIDQLEKLTQTNFFVSRRNQRKIEKTVQTSHLKDSTFFMGYTHHYLTKL